MRKLRTTLLIRAWGLEAVHVQQRREEVGIERQQRLGLVLILKSH